VDRPRKYHKNMKLPDDYYNYFDLCKMEGIPESRAKNAVKDKGVEGIKYLEEFKPIEHLFEVFEKPIKGRIVNSYGIKRKYYKKWKREGIVPKRPTGRPPLAGDEVEIRYRIPKHIKDDFIKIVDNANRISAVKVTYKDMIAVAIQEFCDRRYQLKDLDE
jgi:hypothetical protein